MAQPPDSHPPRPHPIQLPTPPPSQPPLSQGDEDGWKNYSLSQEVDEITRQYALMSSQDSTPASSQVSPESSQDSAATSSHSSPTHTSPTSSQMTVSYAGSPPPSPQAESWANSPPSSQAESWASSPPSSQAESWMSSSQSTITGAGFLGSQPPSSQIENPPSSQSTSYAESYASSPPSSQSTCDDDIDIDADTDADIDRPLPRCRRCGREEPLFTQCDHGSDDRDNDEAMDEGDTPPPSSQEPDWPTSSQPRGPWTALQQRWPASSQEGLLASSQGSEPSLSQESIHDHSEQDDEEHGYSTTKSRSPTPDFDDQGPPCSQVPREEAMLECPFPPSQPSQYFFPSQHFDYPQQSAHQPQHLQQTTHQPQQSTNQPMLPAVSQSASDPNAVYWHDLSQAKALLPQQ
ncbi:hypothetical protein FB107DRAFT_250718 [Schizophyllum commune]